MYMADVQGSDRGEIATGPANRGSPAARYDAAPYDVVIVLGAAVWPGGRASPSLRRRTRRGAALIREGVARCLILTGGTGRHPPAEATVMASIAREHGVPGSRMLLERHATNTIESAQRCREILCEHDFTTTLIVTDPFHRPRALTIFRWFGINADGSVPEGSSRRALGPRSWLRHVLREGLSWPWTVVRLIVLRPWPAATLFRCRHFGSPDVS